jgi:hypothetical protein
MPRDLIVLAADGSMKAALTEMLKRNDSLEIRQILPEILIHEQRDPGVLRGAAALLQAQAKHYHHALAICDRHGCGKEAYSREQLEEIIEQQLAAHWAGRAAAVVIDPELENWFWAESHHVAETLDWPGGMPRLRDWLIAQDLLTSGRTKPIDPKEALERALRSRRIPKSGALFKSLAAKVSLRSCVDPAFLKLRETLRAWFPATGTR